MVHLGAVRKSAYPSLASFLFQSISTRAGEDSALHIHPVSSFFAQTRQMLAPKQSHLPVFLSKTLLSFINLIRSCGAKSSFYRRLLSPHFFVLDLTTSSGMYIKEFVHSG